jgi:hypothetical protein
MSTPSSLVLRLAVGTLAVALAHPGLAQATRTHAPITRGTVDPQAATTGTSAQFQLIVWTNGSSTVLSGLTDVKGVAGAPLPTTEEIRARVQLGQTARPPEVVLLDVQPRSQAAQALSNLGRCALPACAIEIDQLGANGQVVGSHHFSAGTATEQSHTNELEEFSFTFQHITVINVISSDSATDDWLAP